MFENFPQIIKDYWMVFMFIGGLIVGWTQLDARITANTKDIVTVQSQVAVLNTSLPALQESVAEVKVSVDFIKNYLINK